MRRVRSANELRQHIRKAAALALISAWKSMPAMA